MIILQLWEWVINLFVLSMALVFMMLGSFMFMMLINIIGDWRKKL